MLHSQRLLVEFFLENNQIITAFDTQTNMSEQLIMKGQILNLKVILRSNFYESVSVDFHWLLDTGFSVIKSSHQDRGPCYLHLLIGFNMNNNWHTLPIV